MENLFVKQLMVELKKILVTHTHFDHVNDVPTISDKTGVEIYVHSAEAERFADLPNVKSISAGDKIPLGSFLIGVIYTPGHSKGSVSFTLDDAIFTGDTLFVDGIGRTDLEGGDTEEMFKSLRKLSELPGKVIVYPGHHYGPSPTATIAEQKETNPYLKCRSLSDFFRIA